MPRDYAIACETCKQCLELGGHCPTSRLDRIDFPEAGPAYKRIEVAPPHLHQELASQDANTLWPGIADAIKRFISAHEPHALSALESGGDFPWRPDEPDWLDWKQIPGPFFRPSIETADVDLPRNIVDDLGITEWPDALAHYRARCPCVEHPEDLESFFISLVAAKA